MSEKDDSSGIARKPAWKSWALLASLAVNLLLIGVFIGRWAAPFHPPPPPPPGVMFEHMIESLGRDMSESDRAILVQVYQSHAGELLAHRSDHLQILDAIRAAISADPFDRDALQKALSAAAAMDAEERSALGATLLDAASRLSPDGRRRMAEWRPGPGGPPP